MSQQLQLYEARRESELQHAAQVLDPADFLAYLLEDRQRLLNEIDRLRDEIFQLQRARNLAHQLVGCMEGAE